MIEDALLLFSDAQAVTAAAASTSSIDLSSARNVAIGENLYLVVTCDVAMTDASSNSTLTVDLQYDSTTSFTPDATQNIGSFAALSAAGSKLIAKLSPLAGTSGYRYAQVYYTPVNGDLSTGSFTAAIVKDADLYVAYPDGITIS